MALRLCCLALCAAWVLVVGLTDPAPASNQERQNFDIDRPVLRHSNSTLADLPAPLLQDRQPQPAADVIAVEYPFDHARIEQLVSEGTLQIADPEGGLLEVTLRDVRYRDGTRIIRVQSDGLPGVITQRGKSFVATIATSRATYNLSHHHDPGYRGTATSWLVDQRQLDLRVIPNQPDFRHAPPAPRPA